jgi:hypothetical protein
MTRQPRHRVAVTGDPVLLHVRDSGLGSVVPDPDDMIGIEWGSDTDALPQWEMVIVADDTAGLEGVNLYGSEIVAVPTTVDVDTVDFANDELDVAGHPFIEDQVIQFITDNTLPTGIVADTDYYVLVINDGTISIAATAGGAAIDIEDAGVGTHTILYADPRPTALLIGPVNDSADIGLDVGLGHIERFNHSPQITGYAINRANQTGTGSVSVYARAIARKE